MEHGQKKQKRVEQGSPGAAEEGDAWIYNCITRGLYLFVVYSVGKWTQETCRRIVEKLFRSNELPYPDSRIEVFSDGNSDYGHVLLDYYIEPCINYGQLIKIREAARLLGKLDMSRFMPG